MILRENNTKRLFESSFFEIGAKIGAVFGILVTNYATNKVFVKRLFYSWNSFAKRNYFKSKLISFTIKI